MGTLVEHVDTGSVSVRFGPLVTPNGGLYVIEGLSFYSTLAVVIPDDLGPDTH